MIIKTVGELRKLLGPFADDYPVRATHYEDSGCDTCGGWNEEGELEVTDLETRLVFEGQE